MIAALLIAGALALRLISLFRSIRTEKRLKQKGAIEYGAVNSTVMAVLHTAIYLIALVYAAMMRPTCDMLCITGAVIVALSFITLAYVILVLREIWTVKLIIARDHPPFPSASRIDFYSQKLYSIAVPQFPV